MRLYSDNARAFFSAGISNSDLTFSCTPGLGALFPNPTGGDYFIVTFESSDKTKTEKVKVTSRNTDSFTIPAGGRAQEGTTAQSWTTSDLISLRFTSSSISLLVQSSQFNSATYSSTETGNSSGYVVTINPSPVAYAAGLQVTFKASNTNDGNCTVNVNSIGAVLIKKFGSLNLSPGDIVANQIVTLQYDGSFWQVTSQVPSERAGTLRLHTGTNIPPGWLFCGGATVSRTTYSALFAEIGTIYGSGDGSTTFQLPDFRGRVPVGEGSGTGLTVRVLGVTGGEENHILSVSELAPHNHIYSYMKELTSNPGYRKSFDNYALGSDLVGDLTTTTGSGSGHNTMQPFIVTKYIIKV